jgi:hypothetical protein
MLAKLFTAAAIASMAAAPVLAAPASSLSLSRATTSAKKKSDLAPAVLIGVLATVAIVGGAVVLADSDDSPDSN